MSFEPLYIESWIWSTLHGDDTLTDALAEVVGEAPGYQQGVYLHLAPNKDRTAGKPPAVPYIVISREDVGLDAMAINGDRARADVQYRVTVWDSQNGSVAMDRIIDVADRMDALLHAQTATQNNVTLFCRRVGTGTEIEQVMGGAMLYGTFGIYQFESGDAT